MVLVESAVFTRQVQELLTDDEYADLQWHLAYMDAPVLPSAVFGVELRVEIAAIHPACVCAAHGRGP